MLYVQLWWLMKIDKLNKTHAVVPRNLIFLSRWSWWNLFQLPIVSVHRFKFSLRFAHIAHSYQEFSVAFTQYQTDTISKFAIIEGAKNFPEEGTYFI